MSEFKKHIINQLYTHKHGIMGTVIFHLLLGILFLSMGISGIQVPEQVVFEIEMPAPEEIQKQQEEQERKEELRKQTSEEEVRQMLRSIASNENAKNDKKNRNADVQKYIDEVMDELEQGDPGRYKARKDKNYKRDSLQYAKDLKQQQLDSLKSTFYSGESSVSYNLKDRYARFLPIPVFKCEFGGKVIVRIIVNRKGIVQRADIIEGQSKQDDCLRDVAVDAALRSRFNERPGAEALQTGTITYNFVKQ